MTNVPNHEQRVRLPLHYLNSMRRLLVLVTLLTCCSMYAPGQIINERAPLPSTATAFASRSTVVAGQPFALKMTLDPAPSVDVTISGGFSLGTQFPMFFFTATLRKGEHSVESQVAVQPLIAPGDYTVNVLNVSGPHTSAKISIKDVIVHVEAMPTPVYDPEILPSHAIVEVDLSQKQYLKSQAASLVLLRDNVVDRLRTSPTLTLDLRTTLISAVALADDSLLIAKREYIARYKTPPPPEQAPVIFDDLHRRYQAALIELKAPSRSALQIDQRQAHFLTVQLTKREPPKTPEKDWNDHTLTGTYPLVVAAVLNLFDQNIRAYMLISETGADTFSLRLASRPPGARVFYKRVGEPYKDLSKPTDLPSVTFPLATWTFRFEKDGCKPVERTPDPFIESNIDLTVELVCKAK